MSRIARLQALLGDGEAFYISQATNIRYLCGFVGSFGSLLITGETATLCTDSRYALKAQSETFDVNINVNGHHIPPVDMLSKIRTVIFEKAHVSVEQHERLQDAWPDLLLEGRSNVVERLRLIKDDSEIENIRRAALIAVQSLETTIAKITPGQTERQVQRILENTMLDLGADEIAFESIVASGPHSAIPHHSPTDRILIAGDFLKIDFGAAVHGYKSDCTRTFVIGSASPWQIDVYEQVRNAQAVGRAALATGVLMSEVNAVTRQAIVNPEYAATFQHGLGHGVGLAIHEDPFFSASSTTKIEPGMVITIEPGVYLADRGGVRIEDTLVVTPTGYENLTEFSYDLISLG